MKTLLVLILSLSTSLSLHAQVPQKTPPPMKFSDPLPANLFSELSRIINPTVVNISTSQIFKGRPGQRDPLMDLLEQMYGIRPGQMGPGSNKPQQVGLGTGFIIREDGLILTNNHVIEGADLVQVQLSEGADKVYDAQVIGSDRRTDIALIKIKPDGKLPVAALGNSKELQVGEWVAAFGNPFGHGHTMTKGIVSSIGREISEINRVPLVQTDASINPGNSGGPLINTKGYVVGVNSAIDPRAQGIGFAIPIDEVKKILSDLETRGSLRAGFLGIGLGDHNDESAQDIGLDEKYRGGVVLRVLPGSPASKAGIKMYDTITELNGKKARNSVDLMDGIAGEAPGTTIKLKILSPDRKTRVVSVLVGERDEKKSLNKKQTELESKGQKVPFKMGFSVADLTPQLRQELQLDEDVVKPVIVSVDRQSLASMAGLRVGDVILELNKKQVTTASEVMKGLKKDTNSLRILRGQQIIVLTFGN